MLTCNCFEYVLEACSTTEFLELAWNQVSNKASKKRERIYQCRVAIYPLIQDIIQKHDTPEKLQNRKKALPVDIRKLLVSNAPCHSDTLQCIIWN